MDIGCSPAMLLRQAQTDLELPGSSRQRIPAKTCNYISVSLGETSAGRLETVMSKLSDVLPTNI